MTGTDPSAEASSPAVLGFIVGMSRAGTTWMSEALHAHPDAAVFGESAFWGRRWTAPGPDGRYDAEGLRQVRERVGAANMHSTPVNKASGGVPVLFQGVMDEFEAVGARPTPREVFDALAAAVGRAEGARFVIEKTPHHVNWLGRIRGAYPNARFVAMTRDPYGFMQSYKHQGDRKGGPVRERFQARYHPIGCALVYRRSLLSVLDAVEAPDVFRVDLAEVRRTPTAALAEVLTFLGLDAAPTEVAPTNTSFPDGTRPGLDPADVFWMNRIAGPVAERAGYALQPSGASVAAVARSAAALPAWALRLGRSDGLSWRYLLRWVR